MVGRRSLRLDMRPSLPRHLVQRHLGLGAVLEAHHHRLLEHAERLDPPRHAARAPALRLAGAAHLGQAAAQLLVGGELVEEAALEPAAIAEELAVGERHVLGLGHLHGDGVELLEMGRAAELPPAGADAVHELGGVPGADLLHLDPRVELVGEVAHEVAEVHPLLGVERHRDAAARRLDGHVHDLDLEPSAPRQALAGLRSAYLALAPLPPLLGFLGRGRPDHATIEPVLLELGQRTPGASHLAHGGAPARLHHAEVAHVELEVGEEIVLGHQGLAEPDADQVGGHGFFVHGYLMPPWRGGSGGSRRRGGARHYRRWPAGPRGRRKGPARYRPARARRPGPALPPRARQRPAAARDAPAPRGGPGTTASRSRPRSPPPRGRGPAPRRSRAPRRRRPLPPWPASPARAAAPHPARRAGAPGSPPRARAGSARSGSARARWRAAPPAGPG